MKKLRLSLIAAALCAAPLIAGAAPESLRQAARGAVLNNPEVLASWHALGVAGGAQDQARAGYLPRADALASIGRERQEFSRLPTERFTHRNLSLSLTQMVYDGFFTRHEVARLGFARLARYYEFLDRSEGAALEAVRAYADVLRYRNLLLLAQDNYVQHKQVYDQIAERVRAGVGRRVDLEQATGRLALAESNLLTEATNLHDVSARYLRVVGELPAESLAGLDGAQAFGALPASKAEALRNALSASPALQAAVENVRSAQAQIEAQRAAFQPRVDLRARQGFDRNLDGFDGHSSDSVVELVVSYNLYRGGADQARLQQALEARSVAEDLREKSCRDLRQTVTIAYNDVTRLAEQMRYLDQHQLSIEKAREAYRRQFDIGQRTLLDLLDSENEYLQARRAYVNASHDSAIAHARTLAGMGQLLSALGVSRENLPTAAELGQERASIDLATMCPPEAPNQVEPDKDKLIAEALQRAGQRPR